MDQDRGGCHRGSRSFLGGYRFAAALYQADIDALKAAHALALADKEKENRANERKQADALAKAWDEVESARLNWLKVAPIAVLCALSLSGCASSPTVIASDCPKPLQVPASILQSDSTAVSDFSKRVQAYLLKVQNYLSESQESTTP